MDRSSIAEDAVAERRFSYHVPVLVEEVAGMLVKRPGAVFVDLTLGGGGHCRAFLPRLPDDNIYVGLDRDRAALATARSSLARFGDRVRYVYGNFADAGDLLTGYRGRAANALLDLGLSADQIADPARGFSFTVDGPLDMRADTSAGVTAATVVNTLPENELADIFDRFGEERLAKTMASAIIEARRAATLATTSDLVDVLAKVMPGPGRRHPATKVFQALRIYVNDELGALEVGLPAAVDLLAPGGRIFVVSYHSLEDRIVKERFRRAVDERLLALVHKRVVKPSREETSRNPAARSARLRTAERL